MKKLKHVIKKLSIQTQRKTQITHKYVNKSHTLFLTRNTKRSTYLIHVFILNFQYILTWENK